MKKTTLFSAIISICTMSLSAQTLTITTPDGGESWSLNSTRTITWSASGMPAGTTAKLILYLDQAPLGVIVEKVPVNQGAYSWPVGKLVDTAPAVPGSGYKVRIKALNQDWWDQSNNPFTISKPQSLTVTVPNGGESWTKESAQTISWEFAGMQASTEVKLILYLNQAPVGVIAQNLPVSKGWFSWTVGQLIGNETVPPGSGYKVRIKAPALDCVDQSDNPFTISPAPAEFHKIPDPRPLPIKLPKLVVTAIDLVPDANGYSIIFGYKNEGDFALPPRHEVSLLPDYRVLIDGREIARGDLFLPEDPPAGPGYEYKNYLGGFISYPAQNDPWPWNIGNMITIILNERNALGMSTASKTSSLRLIALAKGYDLAFFNGAVTMDWAAQIAHVSITKVGAQPTLSKKFILNYTVSGYHPSGTVEHDWNEAVVDWGPGTFTDKKEKVILSTDTFPVNIDIPISKTYSTFYEFEFSIKPEFRDDFDERNNFIALVRYECPR